MKRRLSRWETRPARLLTLILTPLCFFGQLAGGYNVIHGHYEHPMGILFVIAYLFFIANVNTYWWANNWGGWFEPYVWV